MLKKIFLIPVCFVSFVYAADYTGPKYQSPFIIELPIGQSKNDYPKYRHHNITDRAELDRELHYLKDYFKQEYPDTLIRIMDYVYKYPEDRGYILNNLSMGNYKDPVKTSNIKFIVDYISNHSVKLLNDKIPKNGVWSGQAGNSIFFLDGHTKTSTRDEVAEIAPNGIPFEYGYPNYTSFKIGESVKIDKPSGSYKYDYDKVIENIVNNKVPLNGQIFTTKESLQEYLQTKYADFQYSFEGDYFDLIPIPISSVSIVDLPYYLKRKDDSNYKEVKKM
jgi:hypothetical protein